VCGHITVKINEAAEQRPPFRISGHVENLWTIGAFPVDSATPNFFFNGSRWKTRARRDVHVVSSAASLDIRRRLRRMRPAPGNNAFAIL
jgi:hypothetical protein